ncbi:unnamed protein product [Parajaminaea phylloscopi]
MTSPLAGLLDDDSSAYVLLLSDDVAQFKAAFRYLVSSLIPDPGSGLCDRRVDRRDPSGLTFLDVGPRQRRTRPKHFKTHHSIATTTFLCADRAESCAGQGEVRGGCVGFADHWQQSSEQPRCSRPGPLAMTLLPRRSPLKPRPQSLQVSSASYESPIAIYRAILRLAQTLALRWGDDAIFHAQRHLAQRYMRQHSCAPSAEPVPKSAALGAETACKVTIEQYRPFKRLKSHHSMLSRAEQGHQEQVRKLMDWTYARRGVLRWQALRPFLTPCIPATMRAPAPSSPALLALLNSPFAGVGNRGASSSEDSQITFPLPREGKTGGDPTRKLVNKARNAEAKTLKRNLDRLELPLGIPAIRAMERNVTFPDEGASRMKAPRESQSATQKVGKYGPLHPSARNFQRQKRRMWETLLSEIPVLPPPARSSDGSTDFVLQQLESYHLRNRTGGEEALQESGAAHGQKRSQSRFWLSPERLPTDDIPLLVQAWNTSLSLTPTSEKEARVPAASASTKKTQSLALPLCFSTHAIFKHNRATPAATGDVLLSGDSVPSASLLAQLSEEVADKAVAADAISDATQASRAGQSKSATVAGDTTETSPLQSKKSDQGELAHFKSVKRQEDREAAPKGAKQIVPTRRERGPHAGLVARVAGKTTARLGSHRFVSRTEAEWARKM